MFHVACCNIKCSDVGTFRWIHLLSFVRLRICFFLSVNTHTTSLQPPGPQLCSLLYFFALKKKRSFVSSTRWPATWKRTPRSHAWHSFQVGILRNTIFTTKWWHKFSAKGLKHKFYIDFLTTFYRRVFTTSSIVETLHRKRTSISKTHWEKVNERTEAIFLTEVLSRSRALFLLWYLK